VSWLGSVAAVVGVSLLLVGLLLAEMLMPLHPTVGPATTRWTINAALYLISVLIAAVLVPDQWSLGFGTIPWVELTLGPVSAVALGVLALDLLYYALHRQQHASAFLWRLHLVHHSDLDVDVTTAVRHHPGETLVNCVALGAVTVILGIPAGTIALYAAFALAVQMLQHANVAWPAWAEQLARLVIVTPGLHRRHHSNERDVSDTNFGLVFSIWDRLFGSLDLRSPVAGFGVDGVDWQGCRTLWRTLVLPLAWRSRRDSESAE
jgi:sterol desaturase/sphingolipid hydroxylase (fatty acid hydroxylase superfamily)